MRNRIIWRKYGNIAPFLEDMDHIDEAEEYEKGVGVIQIDFDVPETS